MRYERNYGPAYGPDTGAYAMAGPNVEGVLTRRALAYLVDFVAIALLVAIFGVLIGVLGVFTFGLGWVLYAILWPATAILYSAISVGGPAMGTIGMRVFGLKAADAETGRPVGFVIAAVHALLFYVGIGTLLLLVLDVLIGLARSDGRIGHDLLAGLIVVRRN